MSTAAAEYCAYSALLSTSVSITGEPRRVVALTDPDLDALQGLVVGSGMLLGGSCRYAGADGCLAFFALLGSQQPRWVGISRDPVHVDWLPEVLTGLALARRDGARTGLRAATCHHGHVLVRLDYLPPLRVADPAGRVDLARRAFSELAGLHELNIIHGGINERWVDTTPGVARMILGIGLAPLYAAWRNSCGVPVGWMVADPRFASGEELLTGESASSGDRLALGRVLRLSGRFRLAVRTDLGAIVDRQVSALPPPQSEFDREVERLVAIPGPRMGSDAALATAPPVSAGADPGLDALVARLEAAVKRAETTPAPSARPSMPQSVVLAAEDRSLIAELRDALVAERVGVAPQVLPPATRGGGGDGSGGGKSGTGAKALWIAIITVGVLQFATLAVVGAHALTEGPPAPSQVSVPGGVGTQTEQATTGSNSEGRAGPAPDGQQNGGQASEGHAVAPLPPPSPPPQPLAVAAPAPGPAGAAPIGADPAKGGAGGSGAAAPEIPDPFKKEFVNGPPYGLGNSDTAAVGKWREDCRAAAGSPAGTLVGKAEDVGPTASFSAPTQDTLKGISVAFTKGSGGKAKLTVSCKP